MSVTNRRHIGGRRVGLFLCALAASAVVVCARAQVAKGQGNLGISSVRQSVSGERYRGTWIGFGEGADPGVIEAATLAQAERLFSQGAELRNQGRLHLATVKLKSVIELVGNQGAGPAAFEVLVSIHNEGMEKLGEAFRLYEEKQYVKSLRLASSTKSIYVNIFGGFAVSPAPPNIARMAGALIAEIQSNPEAREALQEDEAQKRAAKLDSLERKAIRDPRQFLDLHKALETIAQRFPDCPTGRECRKRLTSLNSDKSISRMISEERDRRFIYATLQLADQYSASGMESEAKAQLDKLKARFPGKSIGELRKLCDS